MARAPLSFHTLPGFVSFVVPLRALPHAGPMVGLAVGPPVPAVGEDLEAVSDQVCLLLGLVELFGTQGG